MSFGSFLRGIAAQVNPFDNGATYGTYNPPQKKKQDDQNQFGSPQSAPRPFNPNQNQNPNQPQAQKPTNLFQNLNSDLRLPNSPQTNANPAQPPNTDQQQRQKYGVPSYVTKVYHDANGNITGYEDPQKLQDVQVVPNKPQQPPQSTWHALTHNPVTNAVGGFGKAVVAAPVQFAKGLYYTPQAAYREIQNKPIDDIQQKAFGTTDPTKIGEKIVGSTAGTMLTVAAPGASKLLEGTAAKILPETAPTVLRTVVPKVFAGANIGGAFNTAASVQNNDVKPADLLKAYGTGAVMGGATEGAFPFVKRFLPPFLRRNPAANDVSSESPIASDALAESQAPTVQQPTQIPVRQGIPVEAPETPGTPINVRNLSGQTPLIREVTGDAATSNEAALKLAQQKLDEAAAANANARPDQSVSGVTPRPATPPFSVDAGQVKGVQDNVVNQYADFLKSLGEGNGVDLAPSAEGDGKIRVSNNYRPGMGSGRITKQQWLDEARKQLESGQAEPGHQQAFNDAANPEVQSLLAKGDTSQEAPAGKPITVKQVNSIPVADKSVNVPANLPETPGQVRVSTDNAPANNEAAAVAAQPTAAPVTVTPQVKAVLDNPKQFTKQQVAAARNQLKLAKKMAKTAEATAATMDRITNAKPTSDKGFVSTGEFRQGAQGNVTEVAHKATEAAQGAHDIANLSVNDVLQQARDEINQNGVISPETTRNLKAIKESGQFARTSPEFKAVNDAYNNAISHHARALSMTDRTARTTATGDQLANRFVSKILAYTEDSSKLTDSHIKQVEDAENAFTQARDAATAAGEQFKATGSQQDFNAWKAAQQQAEQADRQAKITEFLVSKDVLKGNKSATAAKALQDAEKNAGVYSMDAIDANMLSGTGTMVRNFVNTVFPRAENKIFGRVSSLAVRKIAPIGGSSGRGARIGSQIGKDMFKTDIQARKAAGVGFIRRTVTAGNTLGERNIQATAYSKGFDHYKQILKQDGYNGAELNNRAEFMTRTDPDGLVSQYEQDALAANALSGLTHSRKIENIFADAVQKKMADNGFGATSQKAVRLGAKAVTRVGIGYPTVIGRSMYQGLLRTPPGALAEATFAVRKIMMGDAEGGAQALNKAIQHLGSGSALLATGYALGKAGAISGSYPTDPAERARWLAEGRQPDSIKIGGQWFQIPGYLGGFALPLMFGANLGNGSMKDIKGAWQTALDVSPVDNFQTTADILTGKATGSVVKNAISSLARTLTPAGSFVAETAKVFNPTKADTTTKDTAHNVLDQIGSGIPYVSNKISEANPKLDSYGNVIKNPNPVATVFGAQGSDQKQGTQDVNKEQNASDQTFNELQGYGVTQNKNLMQLVDPKLAKQIADGKQLTPQDVQKIQKSVTKGIDATQDSNWRENGDYATDKAALQVKLQMLNADPTTKPSEKKQYETQIKRDDALQSNNISYDDLKQYESTSLSDWRSMGDQYSDNYDPATYQKLWHIDQALAKGGGSYNTKDPSTQKFSAKQPGSGSGSRRGSPVTGDFGKLSSGSAPTVKQYQTISSQTSGGIPIITPVRPNIVHNISSSG